MQVTLANWRTAPFNRWAFHHVRELVPSADIPNDPARVRPLPTRSVALPAGFEAFLRETDTDGMAIVHKNRLGARLSRSDLRAHGASLGSIYFSLVDA